LNGKKEQKKRAAEERCKRKRIRKVTRLEGGKERRPGVNLGMALSSPSSGMEIWGVDRWWRAVEGKMTQRNKKSWETASDVLVSCKDRRRAKPEHLGEVRSRGKMIQALNKGEKKREKDFCCRGKKCSAHTAGCEPRGGKKCAET